MSSAYALPLLATSAALVAARVPDRYARSFWRLFASGFALLTVAELLGAYYDSVLHADIHSVWPSDVFISWFQPRWRLLCFSVAERGACNTSIGFSAATSCKSEF